MPTDIPNESPASSSGLPSLESLIRELGRRGRTNGPPSSARDEEFHAYLDQLMAAAYQARAREQSLTSQLTAQEEEIRKLRRGIQKLNAEIAEQRAARQVAMRSGFRAVAPRTAAAPSGGLRGASATSRPIATPVVERPKPESASAPPGAVASPGAPATDAVPDRRVPGPKPPRPSRAGSRPPGRRKPLAIAPHLPKLAAVGMTIGAVVGAIGYGLGQTFVHRIGLAVALINALVIMVLLLPRWLASLWSMLSGASQGHARKASWRT